MVRRVGTVYGWANARLVIDYFEAVGIRYEVCTHNNVWTITYDLEYEQYDALPSQDYKASSYPF